MEIWDLYDRDGNPLGRTAVRGDALPEGGYHIVCDILLRHADGDYLLMRRDPEKPIHPGEWEASAGGSALAGETPLACARRELREETGIEGRNFREVNVAVSDHNHCIFHSYVAGTDAPKDSVALQPGETVDYKWLDEADFVKLIRAGGAVASQSKRFESYFREKGYL